MKNNVNIRVDNKTLPKGNTTYANSDSKTTYASSDSKTYFVRDYMTGQIAEPNKTSLTAEGGYCWHRLPCGLCRITNEPCPYGGKVRYEVTC